MKKKALYLPLLLLIICCDGNQGNPFPKLKDLKGRFIIVPYHGCGNCFKKLMDFVSNSTTETGSVRAIILSESIAETKALNSRYFGMKKSVLVTSEYNTNLIEPNTYYYLELVNSSIEKKILLSPIEIDSWIEKNK